MKYFKTLEQYATIKKQLDKFAEKWYKYNGLIESIHWV